MRDPSLPRNRRFPRLATLPLGIVLAATLIGGVLAPIAPAAAQNGDVPRTDAVTNSRAQELSRLQDQLRRRSEEALAHRREQRARLDALSGEIRSAKRRNASIQREIDKRQLQLSEIEAKETRAREEAEKIVTREAALKRTMNGYLRGLEGKIAAGIPWKITDRKHSVTQVLDQLADERTGAAAALAAVGRLQKEQEALARLVESNTLDVSIDGNERAVKGFHLGLLGVIYSADDGAVLGFASAGQTLEEGLETVRTRPEAAKGYLHCVDILNRRRTPQLTDVFLPTLPVEKGGE